MKHNLIKIFKRLLFVIVVIILVAFGFIPNMIYWLIVGHDFMSKLLDDIYIKLIFDGVDPRIKKE